MRSVAERDDEGLPIGRNCCSKYVWVIMLESFSLIASGIFNYHFAKSITSTTTAGREHCVSRTANFAMPTAIFAALKPNDDRSGASSFGITVETLLRCVDEKTNTTARVKKRKVSRVGGGLRDPRGLWPNRRSRKSVLRSSRYVDLVEFTLTNGRAHVVAKQTSRGSKNLH